MAENSTIEWTDATWNPLRGCDKISPGCKHCYAKTFAERWRGIPGHAYEQGFDLRLVPDQLTAPFGWGRSRKVFVNSMSDLFHERVPFAYIELVAHVIAAADWHEFQLLTKRAERLREVSEQLSSRSRQRYAQMTDLKAPNLIVGVSVEDRKYGLPRIDQLRRAKVGKRFLSIEPLLEDVGEIDLTGIDWVIVGGESGPGARRMAVSWVRRIRDACAEQATPFFFKQWGGVRKKLAGRLLDGRVHDDLPRLETQPAPTLAKRKRLRKEFAEEIEKAIGLELLPKRSLLLPHRGLG